MKFNPIPLIICLLLTSQGFSQVYSDKIVGKKHEELKDSIQEKEWPYGLPVWGKKVTKLGYDLPLPMGLNINYLWQESELILNNLNVGFNNGPLHNLDEIIRFHDATASANSVNLRPDIWIFPFLNIYGIFGKGTSSTEINAGVWVPGADNVWEEVSTFNTKANFNITTAGFGLTPTFGVGGGFMALDMNVAWTDVSALDKPVFTFVFGPRLGKTFKLPNPKRTVAIWVGGFRVKFTSETKGNINLSDLIPTDELQGKIDEGSTKVANKQVQVDDWWNGLSTSEQNNPINSAKYETANRALDAAGNLFSTLDGAINDGQSASVQYSLQKNLKEPWNFIVGTQFQLNKSLMLRAEYGFLGARTQFIGGIQYRFGL